MKIFETLECLGQIFSNSLCRFWNDESIPLQILCPSSFSWQITPLFIFSSNNIYFAQKEPIKMKIFETFECSGQNLSNFLCQFWKNTSIPLQILYPSSVSFDIIPLYLFSSNNIYIYTLLKRNPLRWKFLRFSSARVKICQISCVNFETTRRFLSKFCIPLRFHEGLLLCSVLVQTICTLLNRRPLKWSFLRLSRVWAKFWEIPDRFWNEESIPLKILYLFSVSWKIIPQYLFSSKNIYFRQKEPIKMKIF